MLSAYRLRELLDYNPETGEFRWRKRGKGHWRDRVGCVQHQKNGDYLVIRVDNRLYLANRLAWLWMTGEWPPNLVDHENRNTLDNSWLNLRSATKSQNGFNCNLSKANTSGVTGVGWHKQKQRWRVTFGNKHLGLFASKDDAIRAATGAREQCWPHT